MSDHPPIEIIAALDSAGGIGKDGVVPWHIPEDMKRFRIVTKGPKGIDNAVVMGRKTWESIPEKYRPLSGRFNIVMSRDPDYDVGNGCVTLASNFDQVLSLSKGYDTLFAIGGAGIYGWAAAQKSCRRFWLTHVLDGFDCDTHVVHPQHPDLGFRRATVGSETRDHEGLGYVFSEWVR